MLSVRSFLHHDALARRCKASLPFVCENTCLKSGVSLLPRIWARLLASPAAVHRSSEVPPTSFTTEQNIDISSLENTLRAHREANRASVIRKTHKDGKSVRINASSAPLPAMTVSTPGPRKKPAAFKRIALGTVTPVKGTSRNVDILWRVNDTEKTPPLEFRLPWLRHLDNSTSSPDTSAIDRLTDEIRAFEKYCSPSNEEQRAADGALQDLVRSVNRLGDGFVVDVIGSRATNLADPLSISTSISLTLSSHTSRMKKQPLACSVCFTTLFAGLPRQPSILRPSPSKPSFFSSRLECPYYFVNTKHRGYQFKYSRRHELMTVANM